MKTKKQKSKSVPAQKTTEPVITPQVIEPVNPFDIVMGCLKTDTQYHVDVLYAMAKSYIDLQTAYKQAITQIITEFFVFNNDGRRSGASPQTLNSLIVGTPSELQHKRKNIPVSIDEEEEKTKEEKTHKCIKRIPDPEEILFKPAKTETPKVVQSMIDDKLDEILIDEDTKFKKLAEYAEQKEDISQFPELVELMNNIKQQMKKPAIKADDDNCIDLDNEVEKYEGEIDHLLRMCKAKYFTENTQKNLDKEDWYAKIYNDTHITPENLYEKLLEIAKENKQHDKDEKTRKTKTLRTKNRRKVKKTPKANTGKNASKSRKRNKKDS